MEARMSVIENHLQECMLELKTERAKSQITGANRVADWEVTERCDILGIIRGCYYFSESALASHDGTLMAQKICSILFFGPGGAGDEKNCKGQLAYTLVNPVTFVKNTL